MHFDRLHNSKHFLAITSLRDLTLDGKNWQPNYLQLPSASPFLPGNVLTIFCFKVPILISFIIFIMSVFYCYNDLNHSQNLVSFLDKS